MEPVRYSERRPEASRDFELGASEIRVTGKVHFHSTFDIVLPLVEVDPRSDMLNLQSPIFKGGSLFAAGSGLVGVFLVAAFEMPLLSAPPLFCLSFALVGVLMMLVRRRPIEFRAFRSRAGLTVLAISPEGPDRERFDAFIAELVRRIRRARAPDTGA